MGKLVSGPRPGVRKTIYNYMSLPCYRNSTLSMVRFLQENEKEFQPGSWFVESTNFDAKKPTTFNKLVERVAKPVDGFKWVSWHET